MAGADQASDTKTFGRWCVKKQTKILYPSPMAKIDNFSGLGEERKTPRATSRPLDHGSARHLPRPSTFIGLADKKRVDRGLISCRDQPSICARGDFDQGVDNLQSVNADPPRAASRVNKWNKKYLVCHFSRFPHSGGTNIFQ